MKNYAKPSVSVIIPSFNHEKYIQVAIQSVLDQTFSDYELLIADDASSDDSWSVIKNFRDNRITSYKFNTNMGAAETVNYLIEKSRGKYIALLNSDDYWHKDKLKIQYDFMEKNPSYAVCFTNVCFVNEKCKILSYNNLWDSVFENSNCNRGEWLEKLFFELNSLCHPSIMIKREIYMLTGKYNPCFVQLPDYDMWIKVLKIAPIHVIDKKLTFFRILSGNKNTSSITIDNIQRQNIEFELILDIFFENMPNEIFLQGFCHHFKKKGELSELEIECEKAFIYFKAEGKRKKIYIAVGIRKLYKLLTNNKMTEVLKNSYEFTYKDFRKLRNGKVFWLDNFVINVKCNVKQYRFLSNLFYKIMEKRRLKHYDT